MLESIATGVLIGLLIGMLISKRKGDIMAKVDDVRAQLSSLKAQVDSLGTTVANEQAEITEALKRLQDLINAGSIPQDVVDSLNEISAKIQGSIDNVAALVPTPEPLPQPQPEPEPAPPVE